MSQKVKCRDYELVSVTVYDRVTVALRACVRMDTIVSSTSGWKLPDNEADEYEHCAFVYASYSSRLGQIFEGLGKRLFDVTIKYHYMCHMGLAARHLHPRFTWCYMQGSHAHHKEVMQKLCSWVGSYNGIEEAG